MQAEKIPSEGFDIRESALIKKAVAALRFSDHIDPMSRISAVYTIAFSEEVKLPGTVKEVFDLVTREDESREAEFVKNTALCGNVPPEELSVGDIIFTETESGFGIYLFDGEKIIDFADHYSTVDRSSLTELCEQTKRRLVLRPSKVLVGCPVGKGYKSEPLTEAQEALVATAEAYVMRGYNCQYDDTRFTRVGGGEFRWQLSKKFPEDHTSWSFGYINCAAFSYELYRCALGIDLGDLYTTYNQMRLYTEYGKRAGDPMCPFFYELKHTEGDLEIESLIRMIKKTLRIGDLITYRRPNQSGHVMVYVGDGMLVHSTGRSYNYGEAFETYEPTVRYMSVDGSLFNKESVYYMFSDRISKICILRPLDRFSGNIPENTRNRVKNSGGIIAEKLCDKGGSMTVNTGDILTYTYRVFNSGDTAKKVDIRDEIPTRVEYIDGDGSFSDGVFSKTVTISASEERRISYRVKVIGKYGEMIEGDASTVCGVTYRSAPICIERTLTEDECRAFSASVDRIKAEGAPFTSAIERAFEIYRGAGLCVPFDTFDTLEIEREIFEVENFYVLNKNGKYVGMIAPRLYGGRNLQTENLYTECCKESSDRTRLVRPSDIMVGDILLIKGRAGYEILLYTGEERLRDLDTDRLEFDRLPLSRRLEGLLSAHNYFLVLRPSMAFKE